MEERPIKNSKWKIWGWVFVAISPVIIQLLWMNNSSIRLPVNRLFSENPLGKQVFLGLMMCSLSVIVMFFIIENKKHALAASFLYILVFRYIYYIPMLAANCAILGLCL